MWSKQKTRLWECGEVVTNHKNLWKAVERSLNNPSRYIEKIEKHLKNTFFKPDGKASKRAKEAMLKLYSNHNL